MTGSVVLAETPLRGQSSLSDRCAPLDRRRAEGAQNKACALSVRPPRVGPGRDDNEALHPPPVIGSSREKLRGSVAFFIFHSLEALEGINQQVALATDVDVVRVTMPSRRALCPCTSVGVAFRAFKGDFLMRDDEDVLQNRSILSGKVPIDEFEPLWQTV